MLSPRRKLCCALSFAALAVDSRTHAAPVAAPQNDRVQKLSFREMPLRFVSPDYVIQECGWHNDYKATRVSKLPAGVDRVYALEGGNKLVLLSTPEGLSAVKAIVEGLDVPDRQRRLSIRVSVVKAKVSDLDTTGINLSMVSLSERPASGPAAVVGGVPSPWYSLSVSGGAAIRLYGMLARTAKNHPDTVFLQGTEDDPIFFGDGVAELALRGMQMTPYVNADDTVTLTLNPPLPGPIQEDVHGLFTPVQSLTIRRTVRAGETTMVSSAITGLGPHSSSVRAKDNVLLVFVTPTILDAKTAPITVSSPAQPATP